MTAPNPNEYVQLLLGVETLALELGKGGLLYVDENGVLSLIDPPPGWLPKPDLLEVPDQTAP